MEYHLRCSVIKENALMLLDAFCASFKPLDVVSAYENKGTTIDGAIINPHIHCYIKYDKMPTKQSISSFFKKYAHVLLKPKTETAGYSHKLQKKTKEDNIVYTIKGGDIIKNTIGDDIKKFQEKTELINENKTLSSRDKLLNEWFAQFSKNIYPNSKYELFEFIDRIYVLKWKKSPLAIGHKISYSIYILMTIHDLTINKNDARYKELLHALYNIDEGKTKYEEDLEENNFKKKTKIDVKKLFKDRYNKYEETNDDDVDFISDDETPKAIKIATKWKNKYEEDENTVSF